MTLPFGAGARPFRSVLATRRRGLVAAGLIASTLTHGAVLAALWPSGSPPETSGDTVAIVDLVAFNGEAVSVDTPPVAEEQPQPVVQTAAALPPLPPVEKEPEPVEARPPPPPDASPMPIPESPPTPAITPPAPPPVVAEVKSETRERRVSPPASAPKAARKPKTGTGPVIASPMKGEASAPVAPPAPVETTAAAFTPPVELDQPKPIYPASARRRGLEGKAVLRVSVDADGKPVAFEVIDSSGFAILDDAAIEAAKKRHFRPATRFGAPVTAPIVIPTHFKIEDE